MPGPLAATIWYLGAAFELGFVVCSVYRKSFLRYLFLNLYFLLTLASSVFRHFVLQHSGVGSAEYRYAYFYSDALLTLVLYGALIGLYSRVFEELRVSKYVRICAVLLLLGTAGFSYAVVAQSQSRLSTDFAYELSQNLYFVGLVLTYVLWGAILKLGETRTRLVQIVLSLGLYFSAYAASYALFNFTENNSVMVYLVPIVGCLLPLAWTITLWRHSEEARLVPARLVAVPR